MDEKMVGATLVRNGRLMPLSGMLGGVLSEVMQAQSSDDGCPSDTCADGVGGKLTQWATNDDEVFYAVGRTVTEFPPNAYEIGNVRGQIMFRKFQIDVTGLMRLPDTVTDKVLEEIEKFWSRADRFEKYKITQRRGILIAGPSGCGKTCTSKLVCVDVVKRGGVVIPMCEPHLLIHGLALFRSIQPETPIVVLMEDVDEIANQPDSSTFLNMLDGVYAQFKRVVFVATTNHPDRLERRVTNRPSRFDCVITMGQPSIEARQMYFDTLAPDIETSVFNKQKAAEDSDKLSFAHLKELFISVVVLDIPYKEALEKVKKMAEEELPSGDEMEFGGPDGPLGFVQGNEGRPARPRRRSYR